MISTEICRGAAALFFGKRYYHDKNICRKITFHLWKSFRLSILIKTSLMKTSFLLFALACSSFLFGQQGGVFLTVSDKTSGCYYDHTDLIVSQDTLIIDTVRTDAKGQVMILKLPAGKVHFRLLAGSPSRFFEATVQPWQLLSARIAVTENGGAYEKEGNNVQLVAADPTKGSKVFDGKSMISAEDDNYDLDEIVIVSYRVPLLSKSAVACYSMNLSESISSTPGAVNTQSPLLTGGVVGGVSGTDSKLQVRGSRSDGTAYYIDGVKVIGSPYVPRSAIGHQTTA